MALEKIRKQTISYRITGNGDIDIHTIINTNFKKLFGIKRLIKVSIIRDTNDEEYLVIVYKGSTSSRLEIGRYIRSLDANWLGTIPLEEFASECVTV